MLARLIAAAALSLIAACGGDAFDRAELAPMVQLRAERASFEAAPPSAASWCDALTAQPIWPILGTQDAAPRAIVNGYDTARPATCAWTRGDVLSCALSFAPTGTGHQELVAMFADEIMEFTATDGPATAPQTCRGSLAFTVEPLATDPTR